MTAAGMLAPEPLVDVSILVAEADLEPVAATLMRERALHVATQESEHWAPDPKWAELAEVYRGFTARLRSVATALGWQGTLPFGAIEPRPSRDRLDVEGALLRLEARVGGWQDGAAATTRELAELTLTKRQLELLQPLTAPVEELRGLRHEELAIGTLPAENVERVAAALFQVTFALLPLERRGPRTLVAVATHREDAPVLERALESAFFEPLELPREVRGLPPEALAKVEQDLTTAQERATALETRRTALAAELLDDLEATLARAQLDLELCEALRRFPCRDGIYVIAGWVPKRRTRELADKVRAAASGPLVVEALPLDRRRPAVPSLLRNPPWLKPFEALVTTFGLAGYDEINPTPIAAFVFLFMYGMMFGDMGHGALLALAGLALARRTPFGIVVASAGVSSTLFGALYGVAFGAEVMHAPWLRPLDAIFPLLIAAVVAGVVILNLGFVLNLVSAARNRDRMRFWLDRSGVLGMALYWALLGGGLLTFTGRLPSTVWLVVVLPLALAVWFREPLEERLRGGRPSLGAHAVTGFFELFEAVISYLSNTLSFVRLGAFAVAHEGLASMVLRYAHGASGVVVLLVGTVLIVGFEGLIVGIQALRLQYYEFFGRFFQGRGRPFQPLGFEGGPDATIPVRS